MPGLAIEDGDDQKAIVAPSARLVFRRRGQSWSHALEFGTSGPRAVLAESVESDPDRDDPRRVVSPTYQEIHFQADGDAIIAFLVGQFGPHHFSAVIRAMTTEDEGASGLSARFDAADRCRAPIEALAATYVVHGPMDAIRSAYDREARWAIQTTAPAGTVDLGFRAEFDVASRLAIAEAGPLKFHAQVTSSLIPGRATNRMVYAWGMTVRGAEVP